MNGPEKLNATHACGSVSVGTTELAAAPGGTALTWTEQGAYLDGFDGADAPRFRAEGTAAMLDGLAKYLA
jgi:hypothetical protein